MKPLSKHAWAMISCIRPNGGGPFSKIYDSAKLTREEALAALGELREKKLVTEQPGAPAEPESLEVTPAGFEAVLAWMYYSLQLQGELKADGRPNPLDDLTPGP